MELTPAWYIAYLGIMLLGPALLQAFGISVGVPLLRNLLGYYASEEGPSATKPAKKSQKPATAESLNAQAYQLYQIPLSKEYILTAPFYDQLESCILALIIFMLVAALHFSLVAMGSGVGSGLSSSSVMLIGMTGFNLLQMELLSNDIPDVEKKIFACLGVATSMLCFLFLMFGPAYLVKLDMAAVAANLSDLINEPIKKKMEQLEAGAAQKYKPFVVSEFMLPIALSLMAGVQLVVLLTPAVRFGRALHTVMAPPRWAIQLVKYSSTQVALAKISFILPLLALVLWVPFFTDVLPVSSAELEWLQPVSLFVVAFFQFLVLRPCIQAHLYKGFLDWYVLTHNGKAMPHKQLLITAKLELVLNDRAKAAVEMVSLSLFLLPTATLLMMGSSVMGALGLPLQQRLSTLFFCRFFAVWTCFIWWLFSCGTVLFYRLGFIQS